MKRSTNSGADFVIGLADRGTEHGDDAFALCAEAFHGGDRVFQHAGQRALPAGMSRADDAGFGIGKQHRSAIGRGGSDGQPRPVGHHRVGLGARRRKGLAHNDHVRRMDLMGRQQLFRRDAHPGRDAAAVFRDLARIVIGPGAGVEASVDAAPTRRRCG